VDFESLFLQKFLFRQNTLPSISIIFPNWRFLKDYSRSLFILMNRMYLLPFSGLIHLLQHRINHKIQNELHDGQNRKHYQIYLVSHQKENDAVRKNKYNCK